MSGPIGFLARVGFSPKTPQHDAGILIDPPASFACAIGTMPDATAAAEPPLEPPVLLLASQGLWHAPKNFVSAVGRMPNSESLKNN